ncbi:MAG: protein-(glutamine-N5) methyltransferase, release factor-specific [Gammaproteobacteria bacterium]|nr:MAG: protein-(glutamine-N5) methyltransferase, release factor-specific [Gammaproteobacteria bacterium]
MATVAQCLQAGRQLLGDEQAIEVRVLLSHCLKRPHSYLYAWPEAELSDAQLQQFERLLAARKRGEPVAYLTGEREFWSLPLKVNSATLIPRADTELLVSTALALCTPERASVLDLGTGSGAVALALASERPGWQVLALDNSAAALAVAKENSEALGLANVRCELSDWYQAVPGQQFDLILSNPPYIDPDDKHLSRGDLRFEPRSALVADDKGLADIRSIIGAAPEFLRPGGHLLLEHGYTQGEAVRALLRSHGFSRVQSYRDLAGHERVSGGCLVAD